jgi:1,4-dihydroxy-2-naphthoyl-CoA hydrolase
MSDPDPVPTAPDDLAPALNAGTSGWNAAMAITFVRATVDEVIAEIAIGQQHRQPYGVVHGGVYSGLIETVASCGAALRAIAHGDAVVGVENSTSFLRAVREGTLRAVARPVSTGRRTQVWSVDVTDERARLVACGRVRMLAVPQSEQLAGGSVAIDPRTRR